MSKLATGLLQFLNLLVYKFPENIRLPPLMGFSGFSGLAVLITSVLMEKYTTRAGRVKYAKMQGSGGFCRGCWGGGGSETELS